MTSIARIATMSAGVLVGLGLHVTQRDAVSKLPKPSTRYIDTFR